MIIEELLGCWAVGLLGNIMSPFHVKPQPPFVLCHINKISVISLKFKVEHRPIQDEPEIAKKNKKKGYFSKCLKNKLFISRL